VVNDQFRFNTPSGKLILDV